MKPRFECPICLSWLQDPVLTSCGHKFCYNCIHNWLKREGARCPIDSQVLEENKDIFRDHYTSREISQQQINCLYENFGCDMKLSPLSMQSHVINCIHKKNFKSNGIVGNSTVVNECVENFEEKDSCNTQVDEDNNNCLSKIEDRLSSIKMKTEETNDTFIGSTPLNSYSNNGNLDCENIKDWKRLTKNLYERIVTLEQSNQELNITIKNQSAVITSLQEVINMKEQEISSNNRHGIFIWKINLFQEKLKEMQSTPLKMFYSSEFYTHPNGYKICARVNISSKNSEFLSIVIHMMQSDNNDFLDWPFEGTISFILVHPLDSKKSIREETCTKPNLEAFKKPTEELNKRSFGYTEFVPINELSNFFHNNSLVFRIEIAKNK
ncbi:TNF receptor-associated factor 6-A [Microplitis mediator]|uniref:TNF receptor-associated factor 6-A n=1 Tax=Microplitis mediator TaxID=375433 RepID=UPI0025551AB6|nr:TNF receptor-associated factor 6-A [Microplitis mediator]XP_057326050.1 TNF receptor-associated factor 6-A [Microplitis mediator]